MSLLWIAIVLWASLAQTARNAAQRSLVAQAGTLGATLARFLYGLPFAALWVAVLHAVPATSAHVPSFGVNYFFWLIVGASGQIAATAFMLAAMKQRNFVIGVAYSKTDALQVALFGTLFLRELPGWITIASMLLATTGVLMLTVPHWKDLLDRQAWTGRAAWLGLGSGAGFALSAVGYRGAALELPGTSPWLIGAWGVLLAQAVQSAALGGYLWLRAPDSIRATFRAWRVSTAAGAAGALASIGWFTAFALTSAANVRTFGMVEVIFSYLVSRRLLRERLTRAETAGLVLVALGVAALCLQPPVEGSRGRASESSPEKVAESAAASVRWHLQPRMLPGVHYVRLDEQNLPKEVKQEIRARFDRLQRTGSMSGGVVTHEFSMADELEQKLRKEGLPKLMASLAIAPADVGAALDSSFRMTGADSQGKFISKMGWAGFFQLYKSESTNRWVELSERQLESAVGDATVIAPELTNDRILEYPATIESLRSKDGAFLFNLQWAAKDRIFQLTTRNISRQETTEIATQLTRGYFELPNDGWRTPYQFDPATNFHHHLAAERAAGRPLSPASGTTQTR